MEEKNYYDILQVSRNASPEIIEKAYKTLVKKYHPDLSSGANKKFYEQIIKEINEAYDILSNENTRRLYDKSLDEQYVSKDDFINLYNENEKLKDRLSTFDKSELHQAPTKKNNKPDNTSNNTSFTSSWFSYLTTNFKALKQELGKLSSDDADSSSTANVPNPTLPKSIKIILCVVACFALVVLVFYLLNLIPAVHTFFSNIYNGNSFIKFFVDIIKGTLGLN